MLRSDSEEKQDAPLLHLENKDSNGTGESVQASENRLLGSCIDVSVSVLIKQLKTRTQKA